MVRGKGVKKRLVESERKSGRDEFGRVGGVNLKDREDVTV